MYHCNDTLFPSPQSLSNHTMWGVHPQVNGQVTDPLVFTRHAVCLIFYLLHNGEKVHEFLSFAVQELPILGGSIDQLQNKWPSSHNSRPTGKEISRLV
jgi:hypothetical protein